MHRFWANCAAYPALYPLIADYVNIMIDNTGSYCDTDEYYFGTGGYAILALILNSPDYHDLFAKLLLKNA